MSTPNDAARPVAHAEIDANGEVWRIRIGGPDHHCTTPLYTATDYDKLREEVERLRLWRDTLSEQADTNLRDWAAVKAQLVEERTRAEAAEARATTAMNLTDQWRRRAHELRYNPAAMPFAAECIEECAKQLDAALNAQGESNG